jgi:hypothetical protein
MIALATIVHSAWSEEAGLLMKTMFSVKFSSPSVAAFCLLPPLVLLAISVVFRVATFTTSEEHIFFQEFAFLGNCTHVYPPYTSSSILLNRSITRPLVRWDPHALFEYSFNFFPRGESRTIVFARAFIISCIALGVPAFAAYFIIFLPLTTQIYTRSVVLKDIQSNAGSWPLTLIFAYDISTFVQLLLSDRPYAQFFSGWEYPPSTFRTARSN